MHVPLTQYAQGLEASFHRSGTLIQSSAGIYLETKAGEFHVIGTVANYARPEQATQPTAGWRGLKIKSHVGAKYIDAQLRRADLETSGADQAYWRPVLGIEMWRDDARARVMGELNWIAGTSVEDGVEHVEAIRTIAGGVRFFFSKHVTFDIGVRHQSNYDGLAESAIQSRLNFSLPTHTWRDRVIGN